VTTAVLRIRWNTVHAVGRWLDTGRSGSGSQRSSRPVAATCCDTDPAGSWPVAVRLSLPTAWVEAPERRRKARGQAEWPGQTEPETALTLLDQGRAGSVPPRGVMAAADDGDTPNVLADRPSAARAASLVVAHESLAPRGRPRGGAGRGCPSPGCRAAVS
jgi:hypothetical protein